VPDGIWGRFERSHLRKRAPPGGITRLSRGVWRSSWWRSAWLGWGAAAFSVIYPLRTGFLDGIPQTCD